MISVLNFDSNVSIISITFNAVQETKILSTSVKSFIATDVRKDDKFGGVYVNTPVVLSYIRLAAPDVIVFTDISVRAIPAAVSSVANAQLLPSHLIIWLSVYK